MTFRYRGVTYYESSDITSPEAAAEAIIEGIRNNCLRILIGDAKEMDELVRQYPDQYLEFLAASGTPFFAP